jgi:dTDP-glucose 4,6-dehydratase
VLTQEERVRPPLSEVERLWADNSRAKDLFGWQPAYGGIAGFKRGLKETVAWFSEPENLARYKTDVYNV